MNVITRNPYLVFAIAFAVTWIAARIGASFRKDSKEMDPEWREDVGLILGATLTLLGLLIGFSFSMAINRYDQRKNLEEAEANAIGTEYVRADLLPAGDAVSTRTLLNTYLEQRILFYKTRDGEQLERNNVATAQLQSELWSAVRASAVAQPAGVSMLVLSGMNDVLNSQGYTQAAWLNRIPTAAWGLMGTISICSNLLLGYYASHVGNKKLLFLVLPLVLSISFFLIADIDSPRGGVIRVHPQNLTRLAESLRGH